MDACEQHYEQLSNGRSLGSPKICTWATYIQVFHEHANQTVLQSGRGRPGTIAFAVTHVEEPGSWYCGHDMGSHRLIALPPQRELELLAGAGMDLMTVCIDTRH